MSVPSHLAGQKLGHYRILAQIGAGGMGVVYRARDERLYRDVALKVLPPRALADENARKRFRKEALNLSKLSDPGHVKLLDFGLARLMRANETDATESMWKSRKRNSGR